MAYNCMVGNGDCMIEAGRRNACSACRLKKCLDVGMSTTGLYHYLTMAYAVLTVGIIRWHS